MQIEEIVLFGDDGSNWLLKHVYNKERSLPQTQNIVRNPTTATVIKRGRWYFEQRIEGGTWLRHFSTAQTGIKNKQIQIHRFFYKR
jgi:hypothetical protein